MLKKHTILLGILAAIILLWVSTTKYPGGSQHDVNGIGFHWQHNYLSNLLNPVAVNGEPNAAQPWAVAGVIVLALSGAVFFARFSKKIPKKSAANVVKWTGIGAMLFSILVATPLHDMAVMVSGILSLVSIFYITVFVFMTKLHWFKLLCVACMLAIYVCFFVYNWHVGIAYLPMIQKTTLLLQIGWILSLDYFAKAEDFQLAPRGSK